MVSAVSSINQYPIDNEALEIIRRLQSLGISPTGNLSVDRQRLQKAELEKKQNTLATNSEQNLNSIQGTNQDFSSTLSSVGNLQAQPTTNVEGVQSVGAVQGLDNINASYGVANVDNEKDANNNLAHRMVGASQLAELNKLKLGLIA
jgi:hypothetical protein